MAEQPQTIVEAAVPAYKPKGTRVVTNLKAMFPNSPIHAGDITDNERKAKFQSLVLDGNVVNGHGLNEFNRDYSGTTKNPVPDLNNVKVGGGGLPASPYIPNLTSPGPGSVNAADQPIYNGTLPDQEGNVEFGTGKGGLVSPVETSEQIGQQSILGSYISGRSYPGSDGRS